MSAAGVSALKNTIWAFPYLAVMGLIWGYLLDAASGAIIGLLIAAVTSAIVGTATTRFSGMSKGRADHTCNGPPGHPPNINIAN